MKIVILSKYNAQGASSRYRFYNYIPYFNSNDISFIIKPLLPKNYVSNLYKGKRYLALLQQIFAIVQRVFYMLFLIEKVDLIIIEKELFPNIPYFIEKLLLRNKKYALDFDDYIASDYKLNSLKKNFLYHKIDYLAQNAKFVTVGNKWYFDEIRSDNLIYLPTVISLSNYKSIKSNYISDVIHIVWIGSPSTSKYLAIIKEVLEKLAAKYDIVFDVIGGKFESDKLKVNTIQWDSDTEIARLLDADIGIMPLEDTIWEKGKCGFKLIQYMACGLPVVASSSPANFEIVEHGVSGYIANDENEWYRFLEKLIVDSNQRKSYGLRGRKKVVENYSYEVWGDQYCQIIKSSIL